MLEELYGPLTAQVVSHRCHCCPYCRRHRRRRVVSRCWPSSKRSNASYAVITILPSHRRTVALCTIVPSPRCDYACACETSPGPLAPNQPLSPTSSGIIRCYFQVQSKYRPSDVPPLGRQLGKKRKKKDERVRDGKRSILTLTPSHQATTFCFAPPACLNHMSSVHHSHCRFLLG